MGIKDNKKKKNKKDEPDTIYILIKKKKVTCTHCEGNGEVFKEIYEDMYDNTKDWVFCIFCRGKGYNYVAQKTKIITDWINNNWWDNTEKLMQTIGRKRKREDEDENPKKRVKVENIDIIDISD